ncbi:MAG TPA: glutaredoxin family protein [Pyrinomonadaceae bacterium]|jgi:mycoredoxin|nr:glutaredoxin family protein [Pyrinomonadaceae bacterium]
MIKVYGADWCGDTKRTLKYLDSINIDYDYIDVEKDSAASDWVKTQNAGKERKPTLLIGSSVLSVPDESELETTLREQGLIS